MVIYAALFFWRLYWGWKYRWLIYLWGSSAESSQASLSLSPHYLSSRVARPLYRGAQDSKMVKMPGLGIGPASLSHSAGENKSQDEPTFRGRKIDYIS